MSLDCSLVAAIASLGVLGANLNLAVLLMQLLLLVVGKEIPLRAAVSYFLASTIAPAFFLWLGFGVPPVTTMRLYVRVPAMISYAFASSVAEDPEAPKIARYPFRGVRVLLSTVFLPERIVEKLDDPEESSRILSIVWNYILYEVARGTCSKPTALSELFSEKVG